MSKVNTSDARRVISTLDEVRREFPERSSKPKIYEAPLRRFIEALPTESEGLAEIHKELVAYANGRRDKLWIVRKPVQQSGSPDRELVIAFMRPSKAPDAFFEAMLTEPVGINPQLKTDHPSNAEPVSVIACTQGLDNAFVLGVFAEHLAEGTPTPQQENETPAWYLIDRFGARFNSFTRKVLETALPNHVTRHVLEACESPDWIRHAAAAWLTRHESEHQRGDIPYRGDLREAKNSGRGGGWEELRVDLLSVLGFLQAGGDRAIAEYVFAERLLAYPLVDLDTNSSFPVFDSRGSGYLLASLINNGSVVVDGPRLLFDVDLEELLQPVANHMAEVEKQIRRRTDKPVEILQQIEAEIDRGTDPVLTTLCSQPLADGWPMPDFYRALFAKL